MPLNASLIEKAVSWWSKEIPYPAHVSHDDPDVQKAADILQVEPIAKAKAAITPEKVHLFEEALRQRLHEVEDDAITISVDYNPHPILIAALEAAGLNPWFTLPTKTYMYISAFGYVEVWGHEIPQHKL